MFNALPLGIVGRAEGWDGGFLGSARELGLDGMQSRALQAHFKKRFALGELWVALLPEIRAAETE
eukprot:592222-Amphidinium_carterae.1